MSQETNLNTIFFTNFERAQRNKDTLFKRVIRGIMEPANNIISYVVKKINERDSEKTHTSNDDTFNINIMNYIIEQQRKLKQENEDILASLSIMLEMYTAYKEFGIAAAKEDKAPRWISDIQTNYTNTLTMYKHLEPFIKDLVNASNESMKTAVDTIRTYLIDYANKRAALASDRRKIAETQQQLLSSGGKQKSRRVKQSRRTTKKM